MWVSGVQGVATIQSNGNNLAALSAAPALAPSPSPRGGERESDSILEIVWRQRATLALTIGVCLAAAVLYLLVATRYYSGNAKLFVQQSGPQILSEPQRQQQETQSFLFTQREVISSTPVIAMVLATPGIREMRTFAEQDNTFTYFKDHLAVEIGKRDDLISLQFDTPYQEEAQRIVGALVDCYIDYQSKRRHSSSSEVLRILQQEREKRLAELARKQDEWQAFRLTHGMLSGGDDRTNVLRQRLEKLSEALTAAQLETITAKTAFDDVRRSVLVDPVRLQAFEQLRGEQGYSAPTAVDDAQLRAELLQWQAYRQSLSGRYLPAHPIIRNAQQKIDQLSLFYAAAVHRRWDAAKQREIDLQVEFDRQQRLAVADNANALTDARLAREVQALSTSTEELDKRIRDVTVTGGSSAPNITVIEPPSFSRSPTRPSGARTLILALLAGVVTGCGLACVRDWYDYRLRSAEEIRDALGVTVLGLIPHVNDESSPIARGQKTHIDPAGDSAEAYHSLRTAIQFGSRDSLGGEHPARSVLVTSPERGDGKTTVASNLAISMAQAGKRVLLIDGDLRAPMQDLIFSLNGRIGLANVLMEKASSANAIRHTAIEHLDLLPAGSAQRNPAELLNTQKFIDLLDELCEKYDHVVIDATPLLAVPDARIIAASADATVLVLRAGRSNRKLGEMSIEALVNVGAKLLGAVVNGAQRAGYYDSAADQSYEHSADGADGERLPRDAEAPSGNGHAAANGGGRLDEEEFAVTAGEVSPAPRRMNG